MRRLTHHFRDDNIWHLKPWYLAAMTDWTPRDLDIDLSFLNEGRYQADIFADGVNAMKDATDHKYVRQTVGHADILHVHLCSGGGRTAILKTME